MLSSSAIKFMSKMKMKKYNEEIMKINTANAEVIKLDKAKHLKVFKATKKDIKGILNVASSVSRNKQNHRQGFLMNNYFKNREKHIEKFESDIENSDLFYVIKEKEKVLGFLLGYTNEQWLDIEPNWISDTSWKWDFNNTPLTKFVILEKIAVSSNLSGNGIGSKLFERFRKDSLSLGIDNMFSETLIAPKPNFASMEFALKQQYNLAGIRYERFEGELFTSIVYHRKL